MEAVPVDLGSVAQRGEDQRANEQGCAGEHRCQLEPGRVGPGLRQAVATRRTGREPEPQCGHAGSGDREGQQVGADWIAGPVPVGGDHEDAGERGQRRRPEGDGRAQAGRGDQHRRQPDRDSDGRVPAGVAVSHQTRVDDQVRALEDHQLEGLGCDQAEADHRCRDQQQPRAAAQPGEGAEECGRGKQRADTDHLQELVGCVLSPLRGLLAAGQRGLVRALSELGLHREQVDHQEGDQGGRRKQQQISRRSPARVGSWSVIHGLKARSAP